MAMDQSLKVAVIGAGMGGLVSTRELQSEGHHVTVFEKNHKLGGIWLYDPQVETNLLGLDSNRKIVHSSMYMSLQTNLPRRLMSFLDYPFSMKENGDTRNFPGHEEVLRFLNDFARDFELVELIRFGHEVFRVEEENENWIVECRNGSIESVVELFDAVVICSGVYTEPKVADFPGMTTWPGLQIHSHNYRTPEPFKDKIVVLIGHGPSAFDIMREISTVAKEVHQALRAPNVQFGKLEGLENAWQHPVIESAYEDSKVVFQDGSFVYATAIIHCTGYKYQFPYLRTNGIVSIDNNRVGPLYKHVFPPCLAPKLSFIGLIQYGVPTLVMQLQSKWVAKVLSGKIVLPAEEEMKRSVQEYYEKMEENGLPKHHTHKLMRDNFDYEHWFVEQLGLPPLEKWREDIWLSLLSHLQANSAHWFTYRNDLDIEVLINK